MIKRTIKKKVVKKVVKKAPKSTRKTLENKADRLASIYIRLRDSDSLGRGKCVSCQRPVHYYDANCCHFIDRQHKLYRRDPNNLKLGCVRCNAFNKQFHMRTYTAYMVSVFGLDKVMEMEDSTKKIHKKSLQELEDIITWYTGKIEELNESKSFNYKKRDE